MESAKLLDYLISGPYVKMIGVGKLHLRSDKPEVIRGHPAFNGGHRTHIHKNRSFNHAMHGFHMSRLGSSALPYYFIFHFDSSHIRSLLHSELYSTSISL